MKRHRKILDKLFSCEQWNNVLTKADSGCSTSHQLMLEVDSHLASLIYHLENESGDERIGYEMKYFVDLCSRFQVAS